MIQNNGATPVALLIALDRQERSDGNISAKQKLEQSGVKVINVAMFDDLIHYISEDTQLLKYSKAMLLYRKKWGL